MLLIIIWYPLFNFLTLSIFGRFFEIWQIKNFLIFNMTSCFLLSTLSLWEYLMWQDVYIIKLSTWMQIDPLLIDWGFLYDSLTGIMLFVVTSISTCVHIYSLEYMKEDPYIKRFLSYLSFFTFFMLILVTADNLLQMFIGWEGVGLCSYLLINFWFTRIQANKAALKAMIINRIGDFGLAIGIFIIYKIFKTLDYQLLHVLVYKLKNYEITIFEYPIHGLTFATFCLFIGAVGKSAQIGLHTWLPDAMEGPTPVSALIHAATMVTAGIFLICRCSFLFEYTPSILQILIILGSLTAFIAGTTGLVQNDLKRVIAYSTCSQLGYMLFAAGLSNYFVSMFHLYNHAFFKAALFLAAGSIIHGLQDEQDIRKMGGLIKILSYSYIIMLIGSFSLMGFPFLTGFYSKDAILETANAYFTIESSFASILGTLAASATAFYSIRSISRTFMNQINGYKYYYEHAHESTKEITIPLFILSLGGFLIGFLSKDFNLGPGSTFWNTALTINISNSIFFEAEFLDVWIKQIPLFFSFLGTILPFYIYNYQKETNWFNNRKFFYNIKLTNLNKKIYTFLNRKWFFDKIYNEIITQNVLNFAYKETYQNIDRGLLEILGPHGISTFIYNQTSILRKLNMSFTYHHFLLILTSILLLMIITFNWIFVISYIKITLILLLILSIFII